MNRGQVASLALCKVNKNEMLLWRMSKFWRQKGLHLLLWKPAEVSPEVLAVLEVRSLGPSSL